MSALKKALSLRKPRKHEADGEGAKSPPLNARETRLSSLTGANLLGRASMDSYSSDPHHPSKDVHGRTVKDHSRTHSPLAFLRRKVRRDSESSFSSTEDMMLDQNGRVMNPSQQHKQEMQAEKEKHRKEAAERMAADRQRKEDMMKRAELEEPPEQKAKYGTLPPNSYAGTPRADPRIDIRSLTPTMAGQVVSFRARIHNLRKMSAHMMFIEFRQHMATIQGVLLEHANISQFFLYWAEHLHVESVVHVIGVVQEPKTKQGEVRGTTIHNIEIHIHDMHVEAEPSVPLPFTVHEAEVTKAEADREGDSRHCLSDRARQTSRILDLRTQASQGIFRIQSGICQAFRAHLHELGFIEIHTPKLQGAASESGASVFKVEYFGRPAFLAQSPQLGKQMAIAADMRRVFEIGPVFRAENSNTHRHLTEFTGLDLEMAIDEHYHEILRVLDSTFKAIFSFIYTRYQPEIAAVKRQFPHDDLVWLEKTPVIPFAEAIRMLNETGWTDEDGKPLSENEDLGTRDEIQLGTVIKERLGTDYYVLDKFPTSARPFYAMPDPNDPKVTNSFDIFVRGQEILSGGQRIHDANMLKAKMESLKMDPSTLEEYVEGFEWGAPPHGGGGIGLERILMLMLKLNDIRQASMFMRDPRSLPYTPPTRQLRHPEASTLHPPWEKDPEGEHEMQPIEKLIANYGDASNTSWLEPRFETWRDRHTGAAVGYVPHQGYAIIIGDPLCHSTQLGKTIGGFLRFVKKELHLKPLWLLCNHKVEELLGDRHDWRTFSVVAEQRIDLVDNVAGRDKELERKCRHAEKEGIKIHTVPLGSEMSPEVRKQIDVRVQDWLRNRKGKQVHLTDVHPWQDMPHRTYHYSVTPDGTIAGLIIMAQLSPENGLQVKFSLDFPGAPSGAIEYLVVHALRQASAAGETRVTFGAGATGNFTVGRNMKGARVRVLTRAYLAIASELKLTNKSEFRQKLGAKEDPVYICYPPRGLGAGGVRAIMSFFEDGDGNSTV